MKHNNYELSELLSNLGWNQQKLADHIFVHRNTVWNWINDKKKTPMVVILYLRLLVKLKQEVL